VLSSKEKGTSQVNQDKETNTEKVKKRDKRRNLGGGKKFSFPKRPDRF
jgi:hypothetical protein